MYLGCFGGCRGARDAGGAKSCPSVGTCFLSSAERGFWEGMTLVVDMPFGRPASRKGGAISTEAFVFRSD